MGTLKTLEELQQPPAAPEKVYPCEICGQPTPESQTFSLALVYRMPGPLVPGFQCPAEQHFACSAEHAEQAALACLHEHIKPLHVLLKQHFTTQIREVPGQQALPAPAAAAAELPGPPS